MYSRTILSRRALTAAVATTPACSLVMSMCGEKTVVSTTATTTTKGTIKTLVTVPQKRAHQLWRRYVSDSTKTTAAAAQQQQQQATNRLHQQQQWHSTAAVKPPVSLARPTFMEWYESHLTANPILTKMTTGSLLWGLGDAVAQLVPPLLASSDDASSSSSSAFYGYDWQRTSRAAFYGFAIHAPASHMHFNFLEWMTVRANVRGLAVPVFKAFMEQFVYWSWFSNSLYHGAMGAMQGQSLDQVVRHIREVLWDTQKAQWVFWIPIQLLNFQFVPVRHQLNVVLLTSVVWTALLSAWYPPVEQEEAIKEEGNNNNKEEEGFRRELA